MRRRDRVRADLDRFVGKSESSRRSATHLEGLRFNFMLFVLRVLVELIRFDIVHADGRLSVGARQRQNNTCCAERRSRWDVRRICDAVTLASCFYWKPVRCLPRAVVTTRLLRKFGVQAQMVIGYRPSPFFSHAWVEVDGRIVNDSPAYQERLLSSNAS